jgi:ribosomal protein S18 acetylase RimI-like enzyme
MEISADPWLAAIASQPVYRIAEPIQPDGMDRLRQIVSESETAFFYSKVKSTEIDSVRRLGQAGMYVVDVNVVFELRGSPPVTSTEADVRAYRDGDHDAVLAVAESAYEYSRFHLDPLFPAALANRIKREWCANYIRQQRGDRLFVAAMGGAVVGFLAALKTGGPSNEAAVIDLVGVSRDCRRRGVGAALVQAFVDHYHSPSRALQVGTQVANTGSIRLYERLGFSLVKSQYVLHMHVRDGQPVR